jgi:hypothetical protein
MPETAVPDAPPTGPGRPRIVAAVVAVVGLEAAFFIVFAAAVAVELVGGGSSNVGVSVFVVVFFLALAVLLAGCARAVWRGRRSGRAVIMGWQVFQVLIGFALLTSGALWAVLGGVLAAVLAGFVVVALMTRRVVEHTGG